MKTMQKKKAIIVNGVVKKTEDVLEKKDRLSKAEPVVKKLMDSTVTKMETEHKFQLESAKENKSNIDLIFWEEVKTKAPKAPTPPKEPVEPKK